MQWTRGRAGNEFLKDEPCFGFGMIFFIPRMALSYDANANTRCCCASKEVDSFVDSELTEARYSVLIALLSAPTATTAQVQTVPGNMLEE